MNMNYYREKIAFMLGMLLTFVIFFGMCYLSDSLPNQIDERWKQTAVDKGFGRWKVNTNSYPPLVEFEWKEKEKK